MEKDEETKAAAAPGWATSALGWAPRKLKELRSFFSEVRSKLKKVTWPSWKETWLTTMMVFIMVGFTMVFFFVVDTVLAYGERLLIGASG